MGQVIKICVVIYALVQVGQSHDLLLALCLLYLFISTEANSIKIVKFGQAIIDALKTLDEKYKIGSKADKILAEVFSKDGRSK